MLEILTPLSKTHRVSRVIDPSNFVASPGIWADLENDGSIVNAATAGALKKMVISSASDNVYESHDIEVGRISTLEVPAGTRFKTDQFISTSMAQGANLFVSIESGNEGLLAVEGDLVGAGTYRAVAICEEYDSANGTITASIVSQIVTATVS